MKILNYNRQSKGMEKDRKDEKIEQVRILAISDTHCLLTSQDLQSFPDADILIHAGDFTQDGTISQTQQFRQVLSSIDIPKVIIPGNHDYIFNQNVKHNENSEQEIEEERVKMNEVCAFADFQLIEVKGVKILMMAKDQEYFCRNFDLFPHLGKQIIDQYGGKVDILVTHYPPYGILDRISLKNKGGSKGLLNFVKAVRPKIHIFGHIHEGYGSTSIEGTYFYNAAYLNRTYSNKNKPHLINFSHPLKIKQTVS